MASPIASSSRVMLPSVAAAATAAAGGSVPATAAAAWCSSVRPRSVWTAASRAHSTSTAPSLLGRRQGAPRFAAAAHGSARQIATSSKAQAEDAADERAPARAGTTLQSSSRPSAVDQTPHAEQSAPLESTDAAPGEALSEEEQVAAAQHEVSTERELRRLRRTMLDHFQHLGSTQNRESTFRPHHGRMSPKAARELTLSHLLAANAHVGHQKSQTMRTYHPLLLGTRNGMSIIDIEKHTLPALKRCAAVVQKVLAADGVVLFVGTGKGHAPSVLRACERLGRNAFHVTLERWIPGTLTNAPKLLARAIYQSFEGADTELDGAPDTTKLAAQTYQPDLVVVLNPRENAQAVREATDRSIPTIGIVDTNVDPRIVTYAIPGNDDSLRFVDLVVGVLARAGQEGLAAAARARDDAEKARAAQQGSHRRRLLQARDGPAEV